MEWHILAESVAQANKDIGQVPGLTTVLYLFGGSSITVILAMAGVWWKETQARIKSYEEREAKHTEIFQKHAVELIELTKEVTVVVSQNSERLKQTIDEAREVRSEAVKAREAAERASDEFRSRRRPT